MRLRQGCRGAWIALAVAAADRLTKAMALRRGDGRSPYVGTVRDELIPGILNFRLTRNTGAAFSGFSGHGALLAALTALLIAGLVAWLVARPDMSGTLRVGLWMIVGGGLGNLYDRLAYGAVIDFLEPAFVDFAVFNFADACICVGAALAFIGFVVSERRGGVKNG